MKPTNNKSKLLKWITYILAFLGIVFLITLLIEAPELELSPTVAVVPVRGFIGLEASTGSILVESGEPASSIVSQIELANENPNVKAIVLDINSPGGTVVASEEISRALDEVDKPTIAWMREVAASGGYWIAASTDVIVADPATITGSIGVTSSYLEFAGLLEDYGVQYRSITSGKYKDTGSPFKELTPEEQAILQRKVDKVNLLFIHHIAEARNMSVEEVSSFATGEIFLGVEAFKRGLVDVLGSENEVMIVAEELSGYENLEMVMYVEEKTLIELLLDSFQMNSYLIGLGLGDALIQQEKQLTPVA